jgi:hypothetical protein
LRNCLEDFLILLGIFWDFFRGFFWWNFFGGFFGRNFLGGILWEEFFVYILKVRILAQENNLVRLFGEMTNSPALSE